MAGLSVADAREPFRSPIWGDVTLISKADARRVITRLFPDENAKGLQYMFFDETHFPFYHSYLAVRREMGMRRGGGTEYFEKKEAAEKRAEEIAALLGVVFFQNTGNARAETVMLARADSSGNGWNRTIDLSQRLAVMVFTSEGMPTVTHAQNSDTLTKQGLRAALSQKQFRHLTSHFCNTKRDNAPTRSPEVREAVRTFGRALSAHATSDQLLSCITAIELLLDTGVPFDKTSCRTQTLIGPQAGTAIGVKEIFEARHDYVHRGKQPGAKTAHAGINLVRTVLPLYAHLLASFGTKANVALVLDLLNGSERLGSGSPPLSLTSAARILRQAWNRGAVAGVKQSEANLAPGFRRNSGPHSHKLHSEFPEKPG